MYFTFFLANSEVILHQSVYFWLFVLQKHEKCVFGVVFALCAQRQLIHVSARLFHLLHESIVSLLSFFEPLVTLVNLQKILLACFALIYNFAEGSEAEEVVLGKAPLFPQKVSKLGREAHIGLVKTVDFPNRDVRVVVY